MELTGRRILVTGGGSGIGRALAERLHGGGATVIVCGRRADRLAEFAAAAPGLETIQADVARPEERERLFREASAGAGVDVLVNNAGIQVREGSWADGVSFAPHEEEIAINVTAPMHLSALFAPALRGRPEAAIVNVSSGLAFVPAAAMPVYCATKAALHSFTLSLRRQLAPAGVRVVEIVPPAVQTDLGGAGLHDFGAPLGAFADHTFARLVAGDEEIGYGFSEDARRAGRGELDAAFERLNA